MTDVEIDWDSLSIHRGTFTVLLRGDWAHDATWVGVFNESVPPVLSSSWGQISAGPSTLAAWGQIAATIDGKITVQTLRPGNANQLREKLERLIAAANAKMASLGEYQPRTERRETQAQVEQDARDQAMMDEFRQPKS
jgi:hypothetical protein